MTGRDEIAMLKRELASRAIRLMGPRSPFWNCTICGAAHQTSIGFEHKPGCLLEDARPHAIVPDDGHQSFHTVQVQNGIMVEALRAIAEINCGQTGIVAKTALEKVERHD